MVGGTSLAGGRERGLAPAVLGALFVTILSRSSMNLTRIDGYVQMVVLGAIVIVGVLLFDRLRQERG